MNLVRVFLGILVLGNFQLVIASDISHNNTQNFTIAWEKRPIQNEYAGIVDSSKLIKKNGLSFSNNEKIIGDLPNRFNDNQTITSLILTKQALFIKNNKEPLVLFFPGKDVRCRVSRFYKNGIILSDSDRSFEKKVYDPKLYNFLQEQESLLKKGIITSLPEKYSKFAAKN